MTHRTTSATPVSHVFPGRRAMLWGHPQHPALLIQHPDGTVTPVRGTRAPYTPSTPRTAPRTPDCACASYGALEARLRTMSARVDDLEADLNLWREWVAAVEVRLSVLEADGLSERGA